MSMEHERAIVSEITSRLRSGQISRRQAARLLGALSLTAGSALALAARLPAAPAAARTGLARHPAPMTHQMGTPEAGAGPALGEQADGTRVWRVRVAGMDMENMLDIQAFFPSELTINAGDAVYFELPDPPGFHTITFLSGEDPPPLFIPDPDAEPATPAAGPPQLLLNPLVAFPSGDTTYDGTGFLSSGLDVLRQPGDAPVVVTFSQPGSFDYRCIPHGAVMQATIIVQEAGADLPEDQAAVDARGDEERAALIAEGIAARDEYAEATSATNDDGSTTWEVAAGVGAGQARVLAFLPDVIEISAGDTVRWMNHSETEPHTVTFVGAGAEPPEDLLVEPTADGLPKLIQNPLTLFPQGEATYSGDGYVNSGFMGNITPGGQSFGGQNPFELTFDTPGEYPYYCVLHASGPEGPGMAGRVIVR
jgi:plastocyanin